MTENSPKDVMESDQDLAGTQTQLMNLPSGHKVIQLNSHLHLNSVTLAAENVIYTYVIFVLNTIFSIYIIPVRTHHLSTSSLITWHGAGTASLESGMLTEESWSLWWCAATSCSQVWVQISYRDGGKESEGGGGGGRTVTVCDELKRN